VRELGQRRSGDHGDRVAQAEAIPEPIFEAIASSMAAEHFFAATQIGLFEQLAQAAATLDQPGARTAVPRRTLRIVADALVALGFLGRDGDRMRTAPWPRGSSAVAVRPACGRSREWPTNGSTRAG
jgi:hypothetical protein